MFVFRVLAFATRPWFLVAVGLAAFGSLYMAYKHQVGKVGALKLELRSAGTVNEELAGKLAAIEQASTARARAAKAAVAAAITARAKAEADLAALASRPLAQTCDAAISELAADLKAAQ